jgi:hypothetical protein
MTESDLVKEFERKRAQYEASGVSTPERASAAIGRLRLVRETDTVQIKQIDHDAVAEARRELWRKIPKFCRKTPAELISRAKDKRLVSAAQAWDWGDPCLVMCAPTDYAKTSLAALILIRLMSRGREAEYRQWKRIRWYDASTLMGAARAWSLGSGTCPEIRQASTCDLLILDDIGNESTWQSTMFDVLQSRYERELPVIATTGFSTGQLLTHCGDAILRRLVQRNGKMGEIIDCWGSP